ncbi:DUF6194 family protein [Saccharothrix syringae]|uniref:DUF6194 domain-containing protein n=1 Tax=Saccharothrix syringae TaxID=103733 RepID=A0A5Q0HBW3_SACSY|nr:DUF6194 family protein [Saccharothrix syringae]QFZ23681.1 hypothetical protein EKG83_45175 [Saccharothrix syringae]
MSEQELTRYIGSTFEGVDVVEHAGDTYFLYDPDGDLPPERQHPFATIVTGDRHDRVSDLDHPGAYRLNIGLTKATYVSLFGAPPTRRDEDGVLETGFDHAERDRLTPHPVYADRHWVCVVTPGGATLEAVRPLLAEAHAFAARKHANFVRRAGS